MKKTLLILFLIVFSNYTFASDIKNENKEINNYKTNENKVNYTEDEIINSNEEIENYYIDFSDIEKEIKTEISVNTEYKIDLSGLIEKLKIMYPNKDFFISWKYQKEENKNNVFTKTFKNKGTKEINFKVIEIAKIIEINEETQEEIEKKEEKVIFEKDIELLVYEKTLPLIISNEINEKELNYYLEFAKKDGILIYKIGPLSKTDIELTNIPNLIDKYEKIGGLKSDYITIWGGRDFIFDIISKINRDLILSENERSYSIVSLSSFNTNLLKNYMDNFLANKKGINSIILLGEDSRFILLKKNILNSLKKELNENKHNFIEIDLKNSKVSNILFLSNFINKLSNLGYSINTIYIMLIIPFVLVITIFFKHFIGLSPIGFIIPLFITILFLKVGIIFTFSFILFFIIINLILSYFLSKNNLHYAPKMTFLILINMIFLILGIMIRYDYKIINFDFYDTLYFIIFIIISERLLTIIASKNILEYINPFISTIVISLFSYFILQINILKITILSYPEIIIGLIPISYIIGKFTGLKISEYFRFKEIIKDIEE